jgi:hypothetical protein
MPVAWPSLDAETVCALGVGGTLLGLVGLLCGPVVRGRGRAVAAWALAAGWFVGLPAALALRIDPVWWLPPLALLSAARGLAALRAPWVERLTLAALWLGCHPRAHALLLLVAGPLSLVWYAERLDRETSPLRDDEAFAALATGGVAQLERQPTRYARTDAGRSVPLFVVTQPETDAPPPPIDDAVSLHNRHFELSVIRNEPATDGCNCHGWVFAGGRYWLGGAAVAPVLEDNGYRRADVPQVGDLALYRDEKGDIAHSGLVCGFTGNHEILIESKWGRLGRYVHRADQHPYPNTTITYYHSPRAGHLLRGLSAADGGDAKPAG